MQQTSRYIVTVFIHVEKKIDFLDIWVLICFRNAREANETNSQVNEMDLYDLSNAKPGKNNSK